MPKVRPTELETRRCQVRAVIHSKQDLNGWDNIRAATRCGISEETLCRRMKQPEKFTLEELWNLGIVIYLHDGQSILPDRNGLVKLPRR